MLRNEHSGHPHRIDALVAMPVLIVNPSTDEAFVRLAWSFVDPEATPESLQSALRVTHPHSVVRPRELSDERERVWYVYREGRWIPRDAGPAPRIS